MANVDIAMLHKVLLCDYDTGSITWKHRSGSDFPVYNDRTGDHAAANWNSRWAGKPAFTIRSADGYWHGTVFGVRLRAHRVLYAMYHNEWPDQIDHWDQNRLHNSISNLRPADQVVNSQNMSMRHDNKTGVTGICRDRTGKKWMVRAGLHYGGVYDDFEDAVAASKALYLKHGFSPNHGRK